ncbi:MAG: AGE family epimerase/isomerase [Akkermansia sp.]|nr:AGE family epimerase/isomerase [Akkermansia sp.]
MDIQSLGLFYRDKLLNEVVPFWFPRAHDAEHGGLYHCFDADGSLVDSDKSVWAQGRMAWMLLTLYNTVEKRPEWLAYAESALDFLVRKCVDPSDGRMYFHVAADGTPIRKRRYAFSECFAAIAFAAHSKAAGSEKSAREARHWFDLFADIFFTPGRMIPKSTGRRPVEGLGPRMIMLVTAQELRKYLGDADGFYTKWIDRCISDLKRLFLKSEIKAVMETVAPDGSIIDHFDERTQNPGHAIEGGWFILEEARHRGRDPELIEIGCSMIDWSLSRGWDDKYGGLLYYTDVYHLPVQEYWHNMKFWWPHDEALIGTCLAFILTGDDRYAEWHEKVKDWAFSHLQDPVHGEWFGYCERDGSPANTLKGSMWKSFFHHPRALWTCAHYCGQF